MGLCCVFSPNIIITGIKFSASIELLFIEHIPRLLWIYTSTVPGPALPGSSRGWFLNNLLIFTLCSWGETKHGSLGTFSSPGARVITWEAGARRDSNEGWGTGTIAGSDNRSGTGPVMWSGGWWLRWFAAEFMADDNPGRSGERAPSLSRMICTARLGSFPAAAKAFLAYVSIWGLVRIYSLSTHMKERQKMSNVVVVVVRLKKHIIYLIFFKPHTTNLWYQLVGQCCSIWHPNRLSLLLSPIPWHWLLLQIVRACE